MPSYYWFYCPNCSWRQRRYRNLKRCPACGAEVVREDPATPKQVAKAVMNLERDGTFHLAHQALVGWADALKRTGEKEKLAEVLGVWEQLGDFSAWLSIQEERTRDEKENQN
jgi:hypothetical protein